MALAWVIIGVMRKIIARGKGKEKCCAILDHNKSQ